MGATSLAAPGDVDLSFNAGQFVHPTESPSVRALAIQADGKILVGGIFTSLNGNPRNFIARLNADGSVDGSFSSPLQPFGGNSGQVLAITIQADGKILVGGAFNINNNFSILTRLNSDGSLDNTFSVGTSNQSVSVIVVQPDGKIIVGGNFGLIDNTPCSNLARLNTNGSLETALGNAAGIVSDVDTVALQPDGKIVIGGGFIIPGSTRARLTRLNANGTQDPTFNVGDGTNGDVFALAVQPNGQILVGGFFTSINGTARNALARVNSDGSVDSAFAPTFFAGSGIYSAVVQTDGKIFIIGTFGVVDGTVRVRLARLNADGSLDPFYPTGSPSGANNTIWATVRQTDNKYLIGGDFISVAGISRKQLARLVDSPPAVGNFGLQQSVIASGGSSSTGGGFGITGTIGQSLAGTQSSGGGFTIQSGFWPGSITASSKARADFDGDGKTDFSVYRPSDGNWYAFKSDGSGALVRNWGIAGDVLTPGDFDGDGKVDTAAYRPSSGQWYIFRSSDSTVNVLSFGIAGDRPVAGDYDGDGKTDVAQFRPSEGVWYVFRNSDSGVSITTWGEATDLTVPGDYDGDGKTDVAVFRPSTGVWYVFRSTAGPMVVGWGVAGDKPVEADYDGDGKDDVAIYRPSEGNWYVFRSSDNSVQIVNWGNSTDVPSPGDYDGDGKNDFAVFRNGTWFAYESTAGPVVSTWGAAGDTSIPSRYIP